MPQGPDYIFCLQDKDFNFWKIDADGNVSISPSAYFLDFAPDGWDNIAVQNIRNAAYKAIDRTVTIPLGYVIDGAKILKSILYEKGLYEQVYLVIASQQLKYASAPVGILTGGGNLNAGTNTGTITVQPGQTVYIQVSLTSANSIDQIFGNIGPGILVSLGGSYPNMSFIYSISTPGIYNFNLFFTDTTSGVSTATLNLVNSSGSTTASYGYWYKQSFKGEIDLKKFNHKGAKVTVTALEDGLPKFLKSKDKTIFEFPMNVSDAVNVKLDGIRLHQKYNYRFIEEVDIALGTGNGQMLPVSFINQEGDSTGVQNNSEDYGIIDLSSNAFAEGVTNNILFNDGPVPITFELTSTTTKVICTSRIASVATFNLRLGKGLAGASIQNDLIFTTNPVQGNVYNVPINITVTLNPNEYLFWFSFSPITGTECVMQFVEGSELNIKFKTIYQPTYIKAFRPQYLFGLLMNAIGENEYSAAMSGLFTVEKTKVVTCGNAIRNIPDAVMKISVDKFFQFWDSIFSVGLYEKNKKVGFETEPNLIDVLNYIDLPEPGQGTFTVRIAEELLFNELQIGFPEIRNDVGVLNGNEEFNTKFVFSTNATNATGKLEKISPVKTSCYDIEKIRITTFNKETTDFKSDNDIYSIHIGNVLIPAASGIVEHYLLDRSLNPFVTAGLIEPETVFNLWFSPHRSVIRMKEHLNGRFYKSDTKYLYYRSADKNNALICDGIIEKSDINIGSLGPAITVPIIFEFDVPPPEDTLSMLDINPLQVFRFPFQGNYYFGVMEKLSITPSGKRAHQVELRSLAINDLTKLINYFG
jgi:hypothetical protein